MTRKRSLIGLLALLPALALPIAAGAESAWDPAARDRDRGAAPAQESEEIRQLIQQASDLKNRGAYKQAAELWERILRWSERVLGPEHSNTASIYSNLADLYNRQGLKKEAESLFGRALEISEKSLGGDHLDVARRLIDLGFFYSDQELYSQVEPLLTRALKIREKAFGPENIGMAAILSELGRIYIKQHQYAKAVLFLKRALAIRQKILGPDHSDTTENLVDLAYAYTWERQYRQAEILLKKILAIREKTAGPDDLATAKSLSDLGGIYRKQASYSQAASLIMRALAIKEKKLGTESPDIVESLNSLASVYSQMSLYDKAEELYARALTIREKSLGLEHPDTASSMANLAVTYLNQGLYGKAEPLCKRSLLIREKSLGPNHLETAESLNNLAVLYSEQGLYGLAEPLYKRSLAIKEEVLGGDHLSVADSLNNLAGNYEAQGFYGLAEPLYRRALGIRERGLGSAHPLSIDSLDNLASLFSSQGLYDQARLLLEAALSLSEKSLGNEHPDTARHLNNLAALYAKMSLYKQAESLYTRALAITERIHGKKNVYTARVLNNLASLYSDQGLYARSEPLLRRALLIREQVLGLNHPDVSTSLSNLAFGYIMQGLYGEAQAFYKRALLAREKTLGGDHPRTTLSLRNLASVYYEQGHFRPAIDLLARAVQSETRWLIREGATQSRLQRSALASALGNGLQLTYSLTDRDPSGPHLALSTRLLRHGLWPQVEQRQALLRRSSPAIQELSEQLNSLNQRLGGIQLAPQARAALQQQRDALEQQLYRQLPALAIPEISPAQVVAALPSDGVLVEFQRYRPWLASKADPRKTWGPARYLALILKPDGSSRAVPLGEAAPIEAAIGKALAASADAQSDASQRWADVGRLVLEPLKPQLAGSRQWFLSPDGELHRVPFAALLAAGNQSDSHADAVKLRMLTSGRDLVRLQTPVPAGNPPIVIADPNFSRGAATSPALVAVAPQQRSANISNEGWAALPATAAEGREIASLLGTRPISGDGATVALLQQAHGPKLLHIASHGFFVSDQVPSPAVPARAVLSGDAGVQRLQGEDPLLRGGIVLAGANHPERNPGDDGLLTALEATALDLDGTELVVLSACSTGLGDIRVGEGVAGLQSALAVAGARSTLLSLWKVDDKATAAFMASFYQRLKLGEGRADALAATQAEFRNHPIAAWRHPYFWAAWQLVGDWRPIHGL